MSSSRKKTGVLASSEEDCNTIFVSIGKIQASLAMSRRENRAFGLDYSLHTRFLQVKVDCTG